ARAEGHPDANLAGALGDRIREHAVNAYRRQNESDAGEPGKQIHVQLPLRDRLRQQRVHRSYVINWLLRVERLHLFSDRGRKTCRLYRCLDREVEISGGIGPLLQWKIDLLTTLKLEGVLLHLVDSIVIDMAHNSHDLAPSRLVRPVEADRDSFSERIAFRPEPLFKGLIHKQHRWRLVVVSLSEQSAPYQVDIQRREVIGRHRAAIRLDIWIPVDLIEPFRSRLIFDHRGTRGVAAAERQLRDPSG